MSSYVSQVFLLLVLHVEDGTRRFFSQKTELRLIDLHLIIIIIIIDDIFRSENELADKQTIEKYANFYQN